MNTAALEAERVADLYALADPDAPQSEAVEDARRARGGGRRRADGDAQPARLRAAVPGGHGGLRGLRDLPRRRDVQRHARSSGPWSWSPTPASDPRFAQQPLGRRTPRRRALLRVGSADDRDGGTSSARCASSTSSRTTSTPRQVVELLALADQVVADPRARGRRPRLTRAHLRWVPSPALSHDDALTPGGRRTAGGDQLLTRRACRERCGGARLAGPGRPAERPPRSAGGRTSARRRADVLPAATWSARGRTSPSSSWGRPAQRSPGERGLSGRRACRRGDVLRSGHPGAGLQDVPPAHPGRPAQRPLAGGACRTSVPRPRTSCAAATPGARLQDAAPAPGAARGLTARSAALAAPACSASAVTSGRLGRSASTAPASSAVRPAPRRAPARRPAPASCAAPIVALLPFTTCAARTARAPSPSRTAAARSSSCAGRLST